LKQLILFFSLLLFFSGCKTIDNTAKKKINPSDQNIIVEKKKDGSYEIYMSPEMIFLNKAEFIFYYQLIYKYPEDIYYLKIYPDNKKDIFAMTKFSIHFDDNIIEPQIMNLKNQDKSVFNYQIMAIDIPTYNTIKDESIKIIIVIKAVYKDTENEFNFEVENYDKVYFQRLSDYVEDFKNKINSVKKIKP